MRGTQFYEIAEYLLGSYPPGMTEAATRTAVSRIYYAAFLYARDLMQTWGCSFSDRAVHAQVSEGLKCSGQRELIKIGRKVHRLHEERKAADYETDRDVTFDLEAIRTLYADIVPELDTRWGLLNDAMKQETRRKIQHRLSGIQASVSGGV